MTDQFGYRILCRYRPGGATDRLPLRAMHLEYMIAQLPVTVFGGAVLAEDGEPLGMEVLVAVPTRPAAEEWVAAEPYAAAGLFASIEIERVRIMTPPLDGSRLYAVLERERRARLRNE
jgi:uncharacterized protein YciI